MALLNADDPTLFPKLTDAQLDLLRQHGKVRPTRVGEVLFREGDATYDVLVLLEGRVAVVLGSGDVARDITIHRPRDIMIELNILTGHRVPANRDLRAHRELPRLSCGSVGRRACGASQVPDREVQGRDHGAMPRRRDPCAA